MLISRENLLSRLNEYPRSNYSTVFSVMKGVALGNAAFVIRDIIQEPTGTSVLLWIASFFAVVLTNQAAMFGTVVVAWRRLRVDEVILSFLLGILEFGLFSFSVFPRIGPWLLSFAIFSTIGGMLALNAAREAASDRYAGINVRETVRFYRKSQHNVVVYAGSSAILWFLFSVLWGRHRVEEDVTLIFGSLAVLNMMVALVQQARYTDHVTNLLLTETDEKFWERLVEEAP